MAQKYPKAWSRRFKAVLGTAVTFFLYGRGEAILGWVERSISVESGSLAADAKTAVRNLKQQWSSMPVIGNESLQAVGTILGGCALAVIAFWIFYEKLSLFWRGAKDDDPENPAPANDAESGISRGDNVRSVRDHILLLAQQEIRGRTKAQSWRKEAEAYLISLGASKYAAEFMECTKELENKHGPVKSIVDAGASYLRGIATFYTKIAENIDTAKPPKNDRIRLALAICEDTQGTGWGAHYRITVENIDDGQVDLQVQMEHLDPPESVFPTPVPMQFTNNPNQSIVRVPGHGRQLVDIFRTFGKDDPAIALLGAHHQPQVAKTTYRMALCASCQIGPPVRQVFIAEPLEIGYRFYPESGPPRAVAGR